MFNPRSSLLCPLIYRLSQHSSSHYCMTFQQGSFYSVQCSLQQGLIMYLIRVQEFKSINFKVLYQKEKKSRIPFPLILNIELGVVASVEL